MVCEPALDAAPAGPPRTADASKATVSAKAARAGVNRRRDMRRGGCADSRHRRTHVASAPPIAGSASLLVDDDVGWRQQIQHRMRPHQAGVLVVEELEPVEIP